MTSIDACTFTQQHTEIYVYEKSIHKPIFYITSVHTWLIKEYRPLYVSVNLKQGNRLSDSKSLRLTAYAIKVLLAEFQIPYCVAYNDNEHVN